MTELSTLVLRAKICDGLCCPCKVHTSQLNETKDEHMCKRNAMFTELLVGFCNVVYVLCCHNNSSCNWRL
jgi:hypothetical protein